MLKLWNKDRFEAAAQVLQSVSPKVLDALESRPVSIRLKGLQMHFTINGYLDAAKDLGFIEQTFLEVIIDAFTEAGLVLEKDANRKLKDSISVDAVFKYFDHSIYKNRSGNADSFDARAIFGQYGSEEWGECLLREAHLSQRFVYGDNGYYHCCESIPFPEGM
ncbi:uncharacterized protein [Nicotiana tomentosiformis]|uniref:uncharacterized protein n=1 Tax=Nicotiana tomentosiformis TaxID=4098 RepID=UPI00388CE806